MWPFPSIHSGRTRSRWRSNGAERSIMRRSIRRMPELPDVTVYIEALERRLLGARLDGVRLLRTFVLRSVDPPHSAAVGRTVGGLRSHGKPIVTGLHGALLLVP